jgi:hypothetical protein
MPCRILLKEKLVASPQPDTSLMPVRGPLKSAKTQRKRMRSFTRLVAPVVSALLAIGLVFLVTLLAFRVPHWFAEARSIADVKERLTIENEIVKNLAQVLGGAFLVVGIYFTWRNTYLAKEGQITERFNKAIDHLGDEKPEIRLGGIYALARIAKDSPKDHWPIMQVLSAFIRNRATNRPPTETVSTDVQAVLTVLGERSTEYETEEQRLDLTKVNLRHADLRGGRFDRTRFDESDLQGADFMRASLKWADFRASILREAHLRETQLDGANLVSADLARASLRLASLRGANLLGARFQGTTLVGADLTGAKYIVKGQLEAAIVDEDTRMPTLLGVSDTGSQ